MSRALATAAAVLLLGLVPWALPRAPHATESGSPSAGDAPAAARSDDGGAASGGGAASTDAAPAATGNDGSGARAPEDAADAADAADAEVSDDEPDYSILYEVHIAPSERAANVTLRVEQSETMLRRIGFDFDPERMHGFEAPGKLVVESGELTWTVPATGGALRYVAQIDHLRDPAEYDARCTDDWALFRGTDVLPPVRSTTASGAEAGARLRLRVPPDWQVVVPFEAVEPRLFRLEQDDRRLDTPRGWMLAGRLAALRAEIGPTRVALAAPEGHDVPSRDRLALLRWTLPVLHDVIGGGLDRLVIVSAGNPMWRGGLSGPDSLYLHADRPLIEPDGTSPLLHELMHVATEAVAGENGDWVVEGLAELYSIEVLRRSGTISASDAKATFAMLREDAAPPEELGSEEAGEASRDRAVLVLHALDELIRERTSGDASLDDVLRRFVGEPTPITPALLRSRAEEVAGGSLAGFFEEHVP